MLCPDFDIALAELEAPGFAEGASLFVAPIVTVHHESAARPGFAHALRDKQFYLVGMQDCEDAGDMPESLEELENNPAGLLNFCKRNKIDEKKNCNIYVVF